MEQVKIEDYREIPLEDLVIGKGQVRVSEIGHDIEELAESIAKVGLLEPILVCPTEDGRFEILLGQRRFLACKRLQVSSIRAGVLTERVGEIEAKVISVTENLVRRDLNRKDLIDVCTFFFQKYGSIKDVAEQTGLSQNKVREYVKYPQLAPVLKQLVDSGKVPLKTALRTQHACSAAGDADPVELERLALEMSGLSGPLQAKLEKELQIGSAPTVEAAIKKVKQAPKLVQITVTLGEGAHGALKAFAGDEGTSVDDAAAALLEEALSQKGYGNIGSEEVGI